MVSFRSVVFIFVAVFLLSLSSPSAVSAADSHHTAAVRVRIHDYANIQPAPLARTQRLVSRMYDAIGVRTEWLEASRPLDQQTVAAPCGPNDLTIIVLTQEMAGRRMVPGAVVGYAAVTPGEAGRVAFVIYDRVRDIARRADADLVNVMGTVMAHELGHLLLPSGAHSTDGLMRGRWAAADFRRADLQFSMAQAQEIRQLLETGAAPIALDSRQKKAVPDTPVGLLATIVD
jgi:hypothetical protein